MAPQAVTVSANDDGDDVVRPGDPDRFHNQDRRSPESLAQSVVELEAAIRVLEERVASVNADLTYQIDTVERQGDRATRRLALEVAEMGAALSRRIRDQPAGAAPPAARPPTPFSALVAALSGALVATLSVLGWSLFHHPAAVPAPKAPAPVAHALYAPAPPTPAAAPVAVSDEPAPAPPHDAAARPAVHHLAAAKAAHDPAAAHVKAAAPADTPPATASPAAPTPAPTDSKAAAASPP